MEKNNIKDSTASILGTQKIKDNDEGNDNLLNKLLFKNILVTKKSGKSSTIDLYEGKSLDNNQPVIIKVQKISQGKFYLKEEMNNIIIFKGFGIPKLIKAGKRKNNLILIEAKTGPSLEELFIQNNRKFDVNEICLIGIQCIERLKWIHSKNYIHRNIKPNNFSIGLKDPHVIYLQNFYLCEKYQTETTNKHIKLSYIEEIIGSERYGSINALKGLSQGRKDDLESLCYMLIYFFLGKLPWQNLSYTSEKEKIGQLIKLRKQFKIEDYKNIPEKFCTLFNYVKNLNFEDAPKYDSMISLLKNILNENQCFSKKKFCWIENSDICIGSNIKAKKEGFRERLLEKIQRLLTEKKTGGAIKIIHNLDVLTDSNFGEFYVESDSIENGKNERNFLNKSFDDKQNNDTEKEKKGQGIEENENEMTSSIKTKVIKLQGSSGESTKNNLEDENLMNENNQKNKNNINKLIIKENNNEEEENIISEKNDEQKNKNNKGIIELSMGNDTTKQESVKETDTTKQESVKEIDQTFDKNSINLFDKNKNAEITPHLIENKIKDNKIVVKTKNVDKFGQIKGPEIVSTKSKTPGKNRLLKKNDKDCLIF